MPALDLTERQEAIIRDQRTMVGPETHTTVEGVKAAWQWWADEYGFRMRQRVRDYTTDWHHSKEVLPARIEGGTWITDCPNCKDGVSCWPAHNDGACLGCGTLYKIAYPPAAQIEQAVALLTERGDPRWRSWRPFDGETIADLEAEHKAALLLDVQSRPGLIQTDRLLEHLTPDEVRRLRKAGLQL